PDPSPHELEANRRLVVAQAGRLKADIRTNGIRALSDFLALPPLGDAPETESEETRRSRRFAAEMEALRLSSPEAFDALFEDAEKYRGRLFDAAGEQTKMPAWERPPVDLHRDQDAAARFAGELFPLDQLVEDRYSPLLARVRLLFCHAAIRQFRWEEDKLPPNLALLDLH